MVSLVLPIKGATNWDIPLREALQVLNQAKLEDAALNPLRAEIADRSRLDHTHTRDVITDLWTNSAAVDSDPVNRSLVGISSDGNLFRVTSHRLPIGSIDGATEYIQDVLGNMFQAVGLDFVYDDTAGTATITATGGGGGVADPEAVRDILGGTLSGIGNINVQVNDAADTVVITTTATVNATDAYLLSRANHTGLDQISDVEGLQLILDDLRADVDASPSQDTDLLKIHYYSVVSEPRPVYDGPIAWVTLTTGLTEPTNRQPRDFWWRQM